MKTRTEKPKVSGRRSGASLSIRAVSPQVGSPQILPAPLKIRSILVPMDFSDCAKKALQYAIPLAQEHAAAITLLYVVAPPTYAGSEFGQAAYDLGADMRAAGEKELAKIKSEEVHDRVPTKTLIRSGSPAHEIIETAKELSADLIVISTHGRTGLAHVFLGSVAEHVVRRAPCPVLVVRGIENEVH
jgi:universal stress protein A